MDGLLGHEVGKDIARGLTGYHFSLWADKEMYVRDWGTKFDALEKVQ